MFRRAGDYVLDNVVFGFLAGALGVIVFHQLAIWGWAGRTPWSNWAPVPPWGVPTLVSQTFWGGLWGVLLAVVSAAAPRLFPRRPLGGLLFYVAALAFGALLPTLAGWYLVPLFKGGALGPRGVWYNGFVINGAWGLGAGLFLVLFTRRSFRP